MLKHNGVTTEVVRCKDFADHGVHKWRPAPKSEYFTCLGTSAAATAGPVPTEDEINRFLNGAVSDEEFLNGVPAITKVEPIFPVTRWECPAGCGGEYAADTDALLDHLRVLHSWPNDKIDEFGTRAGVHSDKSSAMSANEALKLTQADKVAELRQWWADQSAGDVNMIAEKAVAYGSNSLTQLGRKLAQLQGREVSEEEAQELGCWVNLIQKVERLTDAVMRGERGSDDTVTDGIAYLTMIRRIRAKGSWPGV